MSCREQVLEEVDNIAKANPHIMKVRMPKLVYAYCILDRRLEFIGL